MSKSEMKRLNVMAGRPMDEGIENFEKLKKIEIEVARITREYRAMERSITEKDKEIERLKDELNLALHAAGAEAVWLNEATAENKIMREALEKIEDPRKRDHKEPDAYTQLGCVMHIATEALARIRKEEA